LTIVNLSVTHKKATLPVLEGLRFTNLASTYKDILSIAYITECLILQTCNRVEIYAVAEGGKAKQVESSLIEYWESSTKNKGIDLGSYLKKSSDHDAVEHLFRLASGLESMVVGEQQILGQIKEALEQARECRCLGPSLTLIFEKALKVGAGVRGKTGISTGAVSIASVAAQLAEKMLPYLDCRKALVIGAGRIGLLIVKALTSKGISEIYVASRTIERARMLTQIVGGCAIPFERALEQLSSVDLVAVATAAPYHLLTRERVEEACRLRQGRALLILDLSNPRNVEEGVKLLPGVTLKTIDDLKATASENLEARRRKVLYAEELIRREINHFAALLERQRIEPLVSNICKEAESIRRRELRKAICMLKGLSNDELRVIESLTRSLADGILERIVDHLRKAAERGEEETLAAAWTLFGAVAEGDDDERKDLPKVTIQVEKCNLQETLTNPPTTTSTLAQAS
jgi:glutamyl-tRNA reductase